MISTSCNASFLLSHGFGTERAIQRAAEEPFAAFPAERTHTATQIRFINETLDKLTSRGVIDPARLYDPPFSDLALSGLEGLFSEATVCVPVHNIEAGARIPTVPNLNPGREGQRLQGWRPLAQAWVSK